MKALNNPRKILIINLGGIGDILLSLPSLNALKNKFKEARISILVFGRVGDLVKEFGCIDHVYTLCNSYAPFCLFKNIMLLLKLRSESFDLAINMRTLVRKSGAHKIKCIMNIINPSIKAGRDTQGLGNFLDISAPEPLMGEKYEREYDIDTVKALGVQVPDKEINIEIRQEVKLKLVQILKSLSIEDKDILVVLHPGGEGSRRWPAENFASVINSISEGLSCKFIITGSSDERVLARKIISMSNPGVMSLAGELSLWELFALAGRANLFISNDTGPMHMAAILKTPLIALFGPGQVLRFDPRNISDRAVIFYQKVDCAPCDRFKCGSLKCLKVIVPEEVSGRAIKILRENGLKNSL